MPKGIRPYESCLGMIHVGKNSPWPGGRGVCRGVQRTLVTASGSGVSRLALERWLCDLGEVVSFCASSFLAPYLQDWNKDRPPDPESEKKLNKAGKGLGRAPGLYWTVNKYELKQLGYIFSVFLWPYKYPTVQCIEKGVLGEAFSYRKWQRSSLVLLQRYRFSWDIWYGFIPLGLKNWCIAYA